MTSETTSPPARRRRRRLILALVALLAIGCTATALVWNFTSRAPRPGAAMVFHIERTAPILPSLRGEVVRDDFEEYRQAQIALVSSRRVLNSALNDPGVKQTELIREADPDAVTWLEAKLRISSIPSSSFIRVELDGENTAEVLLVLNAVAKAYLEATSNRDNSQRVRRLNELQLAFHEREQEVERARSTLSKLRESTGGRSYGSLLHIRSEEEFVEEVKVAKNELRRVRLERALLEADLSPADDARHPSRIAVGGGAAVAGDAGQVTPGRSRPQVVKELAVREQFWINEIKDAEEILARRSRYSGELQELKSRIETKVELLKRLDDEIERYKLELRSPLRVSIVEEPHERPRRP